MSICYHKDTLVSASYDGHLMITKINTGEKGEKIITYQDKFIETVPRSMQSCGDLFYMFNMKGMFWYNELGRLIGFTDGKMYKVIVNEDNEIIYIKYDTATIEWWPATMFKPKKIIAVQVGDENKAMNY